MPCRHSMRTHPRELCSGSLLGTGATLSKPHRPVELQRIRLRDFWVFPPSPLTPESAIKVSDGKLDSGMQQLRIAVPTFGY